MKDKLNKFFFGEEPQSSETEVAETPKVTKPISTPTQKYQAASVNESIYNGLVKVGDTVEGYSFMEFFIANKNSTQLDGAITTLESMSGVNKETLILQGNESIAAINAEFDKQSAMGQSKMESAIGQGNARRDELTAEIQALEQQIAEKKTEFNSIDTNAETSEVKLKLATLNATKNAIINDLQTFINRLK